ncbi:MAG TPA: glycoside hydrolase family 15 protein [Terriglobales bacterium]|nr:glycoside hydrolase family 15 protein [Terriglobales bacterium]
MSEGKRIAPGGPGLEPKWTRGAKDAVGTAYSTSSHIWYTLSGGSVTEVYYPTIDSPQIRDLQYLITDGESFFHDERRDLVMHIEGVNGASLGFRIINSDIHARYSIEKTVIGHPHQDCLLVHTKLHGDSIFLRRLQLYAICAPHLDIGGWHNNGEVLNFKGRKILIAYKNSTWLALGATVPYLRCSCGYVSVNDGWTDLHDNLILDWEYDAVFDGNIALTGQLDISRTREFTLGMAFGTSRHDAVTTLIQSLSIPFEHNYENFIAQWQRTSKRFTLVEKLKANDSELFERSVNLILAHEDKTYPGAMIAALSIPWGEDKSDDELGGYHLVWTRDMVSSATSLLAVGDLATPLRALIYLAVSQRDDGGFYQNFWIDGRPYWTGVQLDEASFPIILAWRLQQHEALGNFDPYTMVLRACGYLIREGPATAQDRWEEAAGYSPYTLAVNIAALNCAADFLELRREDESAEFVRQHADFLEGNIERWTVTNHGSLVAGISRHYIRINPATAPGTCINEDPDCATLRLANQPPGTQFDFPAKDIVDAGFLHLVRYGIRKPNDPLIEDSLRVIDAVLKVDTPLGPCWHRYNHDGYGQQSDGSSFQRWGRGGLWPLLTGERGHYELAAGRDPRPYLDAMENFAHGVSLLPEQLWDLPDLPSKRMSFGGPTGAAIPLLWAHSEYIKLLRSAVDRQVFDCLPHVADRYLNGGKKTSGTIEMWKHNRQICTIRAGTRLRILAGEEFILHWSDDDWRNPQDTHSTSTAVGVFYVDIATRLDAIAPIRFTFHWPSNDQWEGKDYAVKLTAAIVTGSAAAQSSGHL